MSEGTQNRIGMRPRRKLVAAIYPAIPEFGNLRDKTIVLNNCCNIRGA